MATLNQIKLSNSTLTSKTIQKSKLTKCNLIRITLHKSSVTDSVLKNCSVYDSIIHTSKLYNCKIYGNQAMVKCDLNECELLPSQPALSKFPVEIREMIFELSLTKTWTGETPSLIITLRCQKELYYQALKVFQKTNRFFMRDDSRLVLFKSMPETVLSNVRSITIAILSTIRSGKLSEPSNIEGCFKSCQRLVDLHLTFVGAIGETQHIKNKMGEWMDVVFRQCKSLQAFAVSSDFGGRNGTLRLGRPLSEITHLSQPINFTTTIEKMSYELGVDAKEELLSPNGARRIWTWNAAEGNALTWKKG